MVKQLEREAVTTRRSMQSVQRGSILLRIATMAGMHAAAAKTKVLSAWRVNYQMELELMGSVNTNMQIVDILT